MHEIKLIYQPYMFKLSGTSMPPRPLNTCIYHYLCTNVVWMPVRPTGNTWDANRRDLVDWVAFIKGINDAWLNIIMVLPQLLLFNVYPVDRWARMHHVFATQFPTLSFHTLPYFQWPIFLNPLITLFLQQMACFPRNYTCYSIRMEQYFIGRIYYSVNFVKFNPTLYHFNNNTVYFNFVTSNYTYIRILGPIVAELFL